MTNYGTLAILALPKMPERQLRFLAALETVTPREGDWREIETGVLAGQAGESVNTAARARAELVAADLIEYRPGTGPGHPGRYRIRVEVDKPPKNAGRVKPPKNAGGVNPPKQAPVSHPKASEKPTTPNAATSADADIALEPLALEPSSLSRAGRDLGAALALAGATDDEIDFAIDGIKNSARVEDPAAYMLGTVKKPGGAARLLDRTRRLLTAQDATAGEPDDPPRPPKPPWCGQCDEDTRQIDRHGDHPTRCPRCHPLAAGGSS